MAPTEKKPIRVLLTGYGPFSRTAQNPSWLAVKDLNGTYLHPSSSSSSHLPSIHISSFEVPVVYESVLQIVPALHARPPQVPTDMQDPGLPVPEDGYDFVMHVGLGGRGGLSIERRGRKEGYMLRDVDGKLAPLMPSQDSEAGESLSEVVQSDAVRFEAERVSGGAAQSPLSSAGDVPSTAVPARRGFGKGYEEFDEELWTDLDVEEMMAYLKKNGTEDVVSSTDAGLYLCEFINFGALAESRRVQSTSATAKRSEVLFVHCPPDGEVLSIEEITQGLCRIVEYVCWISGKVKLEGNSSGVPVGNQA